MNEAEAKVIAQRYLAENPLEHPDYEWELRKWSEKPDAWVFQFSFRCKKDIPQDDWEHFAGAPAFTVNKTDGSVKVLSWADYVKLK